MAKHPQTKSLGTLTNFTTPPDINTRIETLEKLINECLIQINELHERLDPPVKNQELGTSNGKPSQAKNKQNRKPKQSGEKQEAPSPAERILSIIGNSEMTRMDVYEAAGLSETQGNKAWSFLVKFKLVEKTGEKGESNRSLWKATGKKIKANFSGKSPTPDKPVQKDWKKQRQADLESGIAFLGKTPEKLWKGDILRDALRENCNLSHNRSKILFKALRENGHLDTLNDTEVDGEQLNYALKFVKK